MGFKDIQIEFCECGQRPENNICPKIKWDKKHIYVPWSQRNEPRVKIGEWSGPTKRFKGGYEND